MIDLLQRTKSLRTKVDKALGRLDQINDDIQAQKDKQDQYEQDLHDAEQAQYIVQTVAQKTQEELEYHVSELVTLAMQAVFADPYELNVHFEAKRGKTECELLFTRNGQGINPLDASGGGAVDVAAFALQVSLWSLQRPRTRPTLILDEPLKWLKGGDLPDKGAAMIKEVSKRLGLQIIMVSHSHELIESADKVFEVSKNNKGRSVVQ